MTVTCAECNLKIHVDHCWIADEGHLCRSCCEELYPEKFALGNSYHEYDGVADDYHYHQWANYQGLNESYEYCTVCDEKRYPK